MALMSALWRLRAVSAEATSAAKVFYIMTVEPIYARRNASHLRQYRQAGHSGERKLVES